MTTLTVGKPSSNKNDVKNASLAMKSRQQVINEVNKRRTLLQDNSWIKKRPEEENTDENYGRVVLNQYKSQDSLHRNADEQDDQKALLSRYRSDTTLDKISGRSDADKANKLPTLDSRSSKSKEPDVSFSTGNSTSPVKKKRQSWMPPPVSNQKIITADMEQKRHSWGQPNNAGGIPVNNKPVPTTSDKMGGPKMTIYSSEPNASPKSNGVANDRSTTRQISPLKSNESDVNRTASRERTGRNQDLDNLIKVKAKEDKSDQRRSQDQEKIIQDKANIKKHEQRHQDLDDVIQVNRAPNGYGKGAPEQGHKTSNIPAKQSDADHLYQVTRGSSYNASSSHSLPKDTVVYTRTYENSRFPHDAYEDSIPGKSIKTVYSTSDRAIIEKEMCTYCRKPLAMDTKMILDALQICCHASCFKCEVCQAPLENLKAGDSIWIYRNTVHCTPCYSKVKASWAY